MSTTATENTAASGEPQGSEGGENNTPSVEDLAAKVEELTKHSRKWEERAKANKEKADRLDEIEQASLSAEQKAAKHIESLTAKAEEAEARAIAAETALVRMTVALDHGISKEDADLFLTGSDEETITAQAKRFSERAGGSDRRAPRPHDKQGKRSGDGPRSPQDVFGDFLDSQL